MIGMYHEVVNYLDMNAAFKDDKIVPFDIQKLKEKFPHIDEPTLSSWHKEWLHARDAICKLALSLNG